MNSKYLFFNIPYKSPTESNYEHCAVALAEGMKELGITYYGNIDYWKDYGAKEYLIKKAPVGFEADVHVYSDSYALLHFNNLEKIIDPRKINVLIDSSGFPWLKEFGLNNRSDELYRIYQDKRFNLFQLILRSHSVKELAYSPNVKPWAFGLTNRIIREAARSYDLTLGRKIVSNFRISLDIRKLALEHLDPVLSAKYQINNIVTESLHSQVQDIPFESEEEKYYWEQTGRRHRANFYRTLNSSLLTYSFGGLVDIVSIYNGLYNPSLRMKNRIFKNIFERIGLDYSKYIFIYQFDSWRIWESMVSNSCPVNMDFKDWGMLLPVMPEHDKHYWGVKKLRFDESAHKLIDLGDAKIRKIGMQGREWVLQHYAPVPTVHRFRQLINDL